MTCGEPAGIGPEIAVAARRRLGASVPFFWIGDPRHLPQGTDFTVIDTPEAAQSVPLSHLPVLRHDFAALAPAGVCVAEHAQGVIDVIARAVD